ncbi:MAG: protein-L-isoaspartate(D-aspartate) O-methyltransferase [Desulfarculus sp.]|nr:MAG: protein-L-isoaspartate(D-aspartate) O-methyltransferase [Desulfarculus sp.]
MKRCLALLAALILTTVLPAAAGPDYTALRAKMVERQIVARGVSDPAVLAAMRTLPRHEFVPEDLRGMAYNDHPLPIGQGQTISQPFIVAYMSEALGVKPGQKVLEIGTGSGYQAAVLAAMGAKVYSIEILPELSRRAAAVLKRLGYGAVRLKVGDGYKGWPQEAPFDAVIVTAAAPHIPPPLVEQLRPGGRMVIPVGSGGYEELTLVEKGPQGKVSTRGLMAVRFVPLVREKE